MREILLPFLLSFLVLPCFSLGGMDAEEVQEYLLNIDGLEIISDSWNRGYSMYYKGDDGNPLYDDLNNDPKTRAIIDSVDESIRSLTKRGDLLYVFLKGHNVNVYTIANGELYMQTKIEEQGIPFYWEQAGLFVYENWEEENGEYKDYLYMYSADTLLLQQKVPLLETNEIYLRVEYGEAIGYSDTKLITVNKDANGYSIILYDVFTQEAQYILDLRSVFANSKDSLWNLQKINDTTIEFLISNVKSHSDFLCRYDLTKMVLQDIEEEEESK